MEDPPFSVGERIVVKYHRKSKHYMFPGTILGWGKTRYKVIFDDHRHEGCFIEFKHAHRHDAPPPPNRIDAINRALTEVDGPLLDRPTSNDHGIPRNTDANAVVLPIHNANVPGNTIMSLTMMMNQMMLAAATSIAASSNNSGEIDQRVNAMAETIRQQANDILNARQSE